MAHRIETERRTAGGLEDMLDLAAIFLLVIGMLLATVQFSIAVYVGQPLFGIAIAITILINSVIVWLLFRSIAEIIRLQKKSVGHPYSGKISGGKQLFVYKCSACEMMLHSESRCDSCGASIDND